MSDLSRGPDCDCNHYFVVAEIGEGLVVSKQTVKKMDMERFNLKLQIKYRLW
jgi:hypothetical protein